LLIRGLIGQVIFGAASAPLSPVNDPNQRMILLIGAAIAVL